MDLKWLKKKKKNNPPSCSQFFSTTLISVISQIVAIGRVPNVFKNSSRNSFPRENLSGLSVVFGLIITKLQGVSNSFLAPWRACEGGC